MVAPHPLEDDTTVINYHVVENGVITDRIRNHIRTTDNPNVLIGKFHVVLKGRERFLGYFTLTKEEEEHMRTTPYLVQHLTSKTNPKSTNLFDVFELDYMGAAEFEWGQVPSSLHEMRSEGLHNRKRFRLIEIKFDWTGMTRVDHGGVSAADPDSVESIFFLGPEDRLHLAQGLIHRSITDAEAEFGPDRLKEHTHIKDAYKGVMGYNTWWCLDRDTGFLLFRNRDDAARFLEADLKCEIPCPDQDRR